MVARKPLRTFGGGQGGGKNVLRTVEIAESVLREPSNLSEADKRALSHHMSKSLDGLTRLTLEGKPIPPAADWKFYANGPVEAQPVGGATSPLRVIDIVNARDRATGKLVEGTAIEVSDEVPQLPKPKQS